MTVTAEAYELSDRLFRSDLEHYCSKLCKIKDYASGRLIAFDWNDEQRIVDAKLNAQLESKGFVRALIVKPRKVGISTYVAARFYRKTSMNEGQRTYILTHEDQATENLFGIVSTIHEHMDDDYKPTATSDSANTLEFGALDSSYGLGTARTKATGRSDTIRNFHGSEVAFWPNAEEHAAGVIQAVPMAPNTEIIGESTGNGTTGYFYDQVLLAERGIGDYQLIFIAWTQVKAYRRPVPPDFSPSDHEIEYAATHGLDDEQLCWMHFKIRELDPRTTEIPPRFNQEYPATLADAFQAIKYTPYIALKYVLKARTFKALVPDFMPIVLGVDVARNVNGGDFTRIIDRQGRRAGGHVDIQLQTDDLAIVADAVARELKTNPHIKMAFIDVTGIGAGVYDMLVRYGYGERVQAINFGGETSMPDQYVNKRAEMWGNMRDWLMDKGGAQIPDNDAIQRHLLAPCAPGTGKAGSTRYDANNRLLLEAKDSIKKRLGFSPDGGDALCLTFAGEIIEPLSIDDTPEWSRKLAFERKKYGGWKSR